MDLTTAIDAQSELEKDWVGVAVLKLLPGSTSDCLVAWIWFMLLNYLTSISNQVQLYLYWYRVLAVHFEMVSIYYVRLKKQRRILKSFSLCTSKVTVAFCIGFASLLWNLAIFGLKVENIQQFPERQGVSNNHLFLANCAIWHYSCVRYQIINLQTKFGENWSNSKEMAAVSPDSKWWHPPTQVLQNVLFLTRQMLSLPDSHQSRQIQYGIVE